MDSQGNHQKIVNCQWNSVDQRRFVDLDQVMQLPEFQVQSTSQELTNITSTGAQSKNSIFYQDLHLPTTSKLLQEDRQPETSTLERRDSMGFKESSIFYNPQDNDISKLSLHVSRETIPSTELTTIPKKSKNEIFNQFSSFTPHVPHHYVVNLLDSQNTHEPETNTTCKLLHSLSNNSSTPPTHGKNSIFYETFYSPANASPSKSLPFESQLNSSKQASNLSNSFSQQIDSNISPPSDPIFDESFEQRRSIRAIPNLFPQRGRIPSSSHIRKWVDLYTEEEKFETQETSEGGKQNKIIGQSNIKPPFPQALNLDRSRNIQNEENLINTATTAVPPSTSESFPSLPSHYKDMIHTVQTKTAPNLKFKGEKPKNLTQPKDWRPLVLSFLPTRTNFLGEGRYAQVFRGHLTIPDLSDQYVMLSPLSLTSPQQQQGPLPSTTGVTPLDSSKTLVFPPLSVNTRTILKDCAVKRMHYTAEAQASIVSEIFVLRKLQHPNIVTFFGVKDDREIESPTQIKSPLVFGDTGAYKLRHDDGFSRILMIVSLEANGNMWDWMKRNKEKVDTFLWTKWARQTTSALAYIHSQGLIHHDIKPQNILLNETLDAKLSDFGNACFVPASSPSYSDYMKERCELLNQEDPLTTSTISALLSPSTAVNESPQPDHLESPFMTPVSSQERHSPKKPLFVQTHQQIISSEPHDALYLEDGIGRGTLAYTPAEVFKEPGTYSFPLDVYSLGVTLYVMTTGQEPFTNVRSSVHMLNFIKRGFFECGMQFDPYPEGPVPGVARFLSGEIIPESFVHLIRQMVSVDPFKRPTAADCHHLFAM